jgi:hypothetical protein
METDGSAALTGAERERLEALRSAEDLPELVELTGTDSVHEAYFAAKAEWAPLRDRELPPATTSTDLPGDAVEVGAPRFVVHGVTHSDTDAEREFLRDHVAGFIEAGDTVYCEQGIRPMYFADMDEVCAMDDYRWALSAAKSGTRADDPDADGSLVEEAAADFALREDVDSVAGQFREAAFSLIHSGEEVYGQEFARALGDVASSFLTDHEDAATGRDFEAFSRSRRAAEDPTRLGELQRYYKTQFLPQPIEREWLRRHDPDLEAVSHARNERIADYAVFHADQAETVHLVVGAAHQPGVVYYLEQHRDGERDLEGFDLID